MRTCVSNHQPHHCLLNRLFRRISRKTSKLGIAGFCAGNSPVTGELPAQMASNEENVSIWWRHQVPKWCPCYKLFGDLQCTHLYKYLYKNSIFFHKRVYTMFKVYNIMENVLVAKNCSSLMQTCSLCGAKLKTWFQFYFKYSVDLYPKAEVIPSKFANYVTPLQRQSSKWH